MQAADLLMYVHCYYCFTNILNNQVSIVWRGNALGFTQRHDSERHGELREHYLDAVAVTMAGRAAEDICCGTISGGAVGDLKTVSNASTTAAITTAVMLLLQLTSSSVT
jgi:ATP-dependent Zn protease